MCRDNFSCKLKYFSTPCLFHGWKIHLHFVFKLDFAFTVFVLFKQVSYFFHDLGKLRRGFFWTIRRGFKSSFQSIQIKYLKGRHVLQKEISGSKKCSNIRIFDVVVSNFFVFGSIFLQNLFIAVLKIWGSCSLIPNESNLSSWFENTKEFFPCLFSFEPIELSR